MTGFGALYMFLGLAFGALTLLSVQRGKRDEEFAQVVVALLVAVLWPLPLLAIACYLAFPEGGEAPPPGPPRP